MNKISAQNDGFSLIELIVTLSVLGILLGLAAPNVSAFYRSQLVISQANEMISLLSFARSEAIRRNTSVTLCRADNATAETCATSAGTWSYWLVLGNNTVISRGFVTSRGQLAQTSNLHNDQINFGADGLAYSQGNLLSQQALQIKADMYIRCIRLGAGNQARVIKAQQACF